MIGFYDILPFLVKSEKLEHHKVTITTIHKMCSAINAGRPLNMLLIDIYIFVANYRNLMKLMLFRLIKYDICPYIARRDI